MASKQPDLAVGLPAVGLGIWPGTAEKGLIRAAGEGAKIVGHAKEQDHFRL